MSRTRYNAKYLVSRPVFREGRYESGGYSAVYPTRNSRVLLYVTDSSLKIEWLKHMGVTLDAVQSNIQINGSHWKHAVSVRKLEPFYHNHPRRAWLNTEQDLMDDIWVESRNAVGGSSYRTDKLYQQTIYDRSSEFPIMGTAIRWAYEKFGVMSFDIKSDNFLVDPVSDYVFPYDIINIEYSAQLAGIPHKDR